MNSSNQKERPLISLRVLFGILFFLLMCGTIILSLIINAAFYIPLALVNIVRFLIQGMGFSMFAVLAGVMEMIGRGAVALLFVPKFGFIAICLASPAAWILADAFLIPAFIMVRNRLRRIFQGQVEVY